METISDEMEITLDNVFNRFRYNNFKVDASKCHLFLKSINIKSSVIEGTSCEKFLGITTDNNFIFKEHINIVYRNTCISIDYDINELCKKGNLKLHALTKYDKFMNTEKRRLKAVFHSVKISLRADFLELKIPRGKI